MADFDWVKARAACSLGVLFKQLEVAAKRDVDSANELARSIGSAVKFELAAHGNHFVVTRERLGDDIETVEFTLSKAKISVHSGAQVEFTAKPILNAEGGCKLMVDSAELELWQVCRMALEDLIFSE